ncbi:MAG: peptide-methionine (S)-S-oxide reductase MsrA [Bradymonadia bacterium]
MRSTLLLTAFAALVFTGCSTSTEAAPSSQPGVGSAPSKALSDTPPAGMEIATFAGGCFWCMEGPFDAIEGVQETLSGYTDGHKLNPTYKEVSAGYTGHTEAIRVIFDPKKVTYAQLVEIFWHNIDPTTENRQFCDAGTQYRTGIYYHSAEQKRIAEASKAKLVAAKTLPGAVVTPVKAANPFYAAEDYHQDFYKKNPTHYQRYRRGCGRDARLKELWGESAGH